MIIVQRRFYSNAYSNAEETGLSGILNSIYALSE